MKPSGSGFSSGLLHYIDSLCDFRAVLHRSAVGPIDHDVLGEDAGLLCPGGSAVPVSLPNDVLANARSVPGYLPMLSNRNLEVECRLR